MNDRSAEGLRRRLAHLSLVVLMVAVTLAAFSHMACNGHTRKTSDIQADIDARQRRQQEVENQLRDVHGSEYDPATGQWSQGYGGRGPLAITSTNLQAERQALINEHRNCRDTLADLRDELQDAQSSSSHGSDVGRQGAGAAGSVNVPTTGGAGHSHPH